MLAQIFQVKPYFSLIFGNFYCCYFIIVLKNSFLVFDTLIETLAMLREHLRSCKPLRFALWFAYSQHRACLDQSLNTENWFLLLKYLSYFTVFCSF